MNHLLDQSGDTGLDLRGRAETVSIKKYTCLPIYLQITETPRYVSSNFRYKNIRIDNLTKAHYKKVPFRVIFPPNHVNVQPILYVNSGQFPIEERLDKSLVPWSSCSCTVYCNIISGTITTG